MQLDVVNHSNEKIGDDQFKVPEGYTTIKQ